MQTLSHDAYLALREGAEVIEYDGHGDKVLRLTNGSYLKLFRRKRLISSAAWYPYAQRFADNCLALKEKDIPAPTVIAVYRIPSIRRDAVHYYPLEGDTLRTLIRRNISPADAQSLKHAFTRFVINLHNHGIYFRSLHLGNVIISPGGSFGLIDVADLKVHPHPLSPGLRVRNLRRLLCNTEESNWIDSDAALSIPPPRRVLP